MAQPLPQPAIRPLTLDDFGQIIIDLRTEEVLVNVGLVDADGNRVKVASTTVPFTKAIATAIKAELAEDGALLASIHAAFGFPE